MSAIASQRTEAKTASTKHLDGLDALRGYAAIGVLLFHASGLLHAPWLMPSGYLAVDIFFVMSGYVIANAYEAKLPSMGMVAFLRVRAIRLYPLFLLGLAIGLLRGLILIHRGLAPTGVITALLANLVYLPAPPSAFSGGVISPLNAPGWSLIFEVWVNVAYAALLPKLSKRALMVLVIASGAIMLGLAIAGRPEIGGNEWGNLWLGVPRVIFSFSLGILLFRCRAKLPDLRWLAPLMPLALVIVFQIPTSEWIDMAVILVASPLLVIAAVQGGAPHRLALYGGAASYALYAIHFPLLELCSGAVNTMHLSSVPLGLGLVLALLVGCPLLDRFYDRPIRRWLRRYQAAFRS
jgi:peptidoglycan/LPS O-acetylase OafA/YrhL